MTKKPLLNAALALLYIITISSVMFYAPKKIDATPSVLVPIVMLSLFTLSAAIMGYIFFSQPIQLYLDGEKKLAVNLFLKTVVSFAGITATLFLLILFL